MFKVPVKIGKSNIEGKGVFATKDIAKGSLVWIFTEGHDIKMTISEYDVLSPRYKNKINKIGYLSPWTNLWVFPPKGDPAQYTNHSSHNNLSVIYDKSISSEPYFVAKRDIPSGEELTNNYHEFDLITQRTQPTWAK